MATLYHTGEAVHYWCADESRLGLKTITRRRITQRGVKPIGQVQWTFQAYYLYGMIEPLSGDSFFFEFSHLNSFCFQAFLDEFAKAHLQGIHIIQLDNARAHTAQRLVIPQNVILWFQPPHAPECNPIERFWALLKSRLAWRLFDSLSVLQDSVSSFLNSFSPSSFASLAGHQSLRQDLHYLGTCNIYMG